MNTANLQQQLFDVIKRRVTENIPAADEVARILDISTDSAYRRIRGEKSISLDELNILCNHYRISLDQLMSIQTGGFIFQGQLTERDKFNYKDYLTGIMNALAYYNSCKEKEIHFLCKDLPLFHFFHFREIAAFKYYFWMRTFFHAPEFRNTKFRFDCYPDELFEIGKKIISIYNQVPSYEVWNVETINIMLHQIEYYRDSSVFESEEDVFRVYEAFENLIDHMERQAAAGFKFSHGERPPTQGIPFQMYFNEVIIGDNSIMVIIDGIKTTFITHNIFNYMTTKDTAFNDNMHNYMQNLMRKSTLISTASEKERTKFFRLLKEKITRKKNALKV